MISRLACELQAGPLTDERNERRQMCDDRYALMIIYIVLSLGLALLVGGCAQEALQARPDVLTITVSILPQRFFVERIGGDRVDVNVMVLPGESPATYEPRPAQLKALTESDAYVSIGVPFEAAWLERIASANTGMLMVDTTEGIERIGEGQSPDPHIWLSPRLVKIQVDTIYEGLAALDPRHQAEYAANLDAFAEELSDLDADIQETLAGIGQRKFMVLHPSWGYFARDYGLEMLPVEVGGQEPSAAELAELIDYARRENIRVIFAQPEFSTKAAETIANEIGGRVLLINPLAEDWMVNMRRVAATFGEVLDS